MSSLSLFPPCPSAFPPPIFHSSCLSLSPLYSSLHLFSVMHSLSLSPPFSVLPALLSKDGLYFCLFIILCPSLLPQHTHTLKIPPSFWLSSSAILAISSCFPKSVFSKNSINQRPLGFFTYDYLWSCCSYHFHAPDKCTEYSTQPRQEHFITGQMRRGNTCYLLKRGLVFPVSFASHSRSGKPPYDSILHLKHM